VTCSPVPERGIGTSYRNWWPATLRPRARTTIRSAAGVIANTTRRSERLERCFTGAATPTLNMRVLKNVKCLDLGHIGYGMVAVALVIWPGAALVWGSRIQPKERT
jgi:hypothetical protein